MRILKHAAAVARLLASGAMMTVVATAGVKIDDAALGETLGGWKKRGKQAAEYSLSGTTYRTYKPETSPTPEGGIFVSIRIDHVRGWLSSDDHAILEITINDKGVIQSAQSNIAIQGRSITSDVILGGNQAGQKLTGADRAVQIGTDLVANLSAKLLREKIVEAGRVSFPAAIRHNYNLLFQAIRVEEPAPATPSVETNQDEASRNSNGAAAPEEVEVPAIPKEPAAPVPPAAPKETNVPNAGPDLKITPYGTPKKADLPASP